MPTQTERSAATRRALVSAARRLWGARGYAEVGTPEIAQAAGVTRGAMSCASTPIRPPYSRPSSRTSRTRSSNGWRPWSRRRDPKSPAEALYVAADAWLDIAREPEIRRLVLLDGPGVLGWAAFREISQRHATGMTEQLLTAAIEAGEARPQPVRPLATMMIGALDEAAMIIIANSDDPAREQDEVRAVAHNLIAGLLRPRMPS